MKIGYACLTIGVPNASYRTCTMKNADNAKLLELIEHNLDVLERVIEYNVKQNIKLFRISSDIIPFGSSPTNMLAWEELFADRLSNIGTKAKNADMRLSMHPGQYTVLNSPNPDVVERAIKDLEYHARFLDSLDLDSEHKIILHIGGVYNDKDAAIQRFTSVYRQLPQSIKNRLIIENDDCSYSVEEVLDISHQTGAPVVFDVFHHSVCESITKKSVYEWLETCKQTWKCEDGLMKIHYSQQEPGKRPGSHSRTIHVKEFMEFYNNLPDADIDIMLEVKDKNLSANKCISLTAQSGEIKTLEAEWSKYKYTILEKDHSIYEAIRELLKEKTEYPVVEFYTLLEQALEKETSIGNAMNAAQHVWGYLKDISSEQEKKQLIKSMESYKKGKRSLKAIKNYLWRISVKYEKDDLLDSYYFEL